MLGFVVRMKIITKQNCVWVQICLCATRYVHSLVSWHVDNSVCCCFPKDDSEAPLSKGELILCNLLGICRFSVIFLVLCYNNYLFIIKLVAFQKKKKGGGLVTSSSCQCERVYFFFFSVSRFDSLNFWSFSTKLAANTLLLEAIFYFPHSVKPTCRTRERKRLERHFV